jgi:deoxycytidine triphosphate deaminase
MANTDTAKAVAKAPAEKKVKIKLPLTRTEKDDVYVALNGKAYLIKRGEEVEVPEGVVEILQHREEMLSQAMEFEAQAAANVL